MAEEPLPPKGGETYLTFERRCRWSLCRLPLFKTATQQELLDCTHSKAHTFEKEQWGITMQIGV